MSTQSNLYSQGGGGHEYAVEGQSAMFLLFLLGCSAPGLPQTTITEFRQQAGSLGYETDDLLLYCNALTQHHKVLFQIKHNIIISEKSELFPEVVTAVWKDFNNSNLFNKQTDRIYLVKGAMTLHEKNHLKQLLNWAKLKATRVDFTNGNPLGAIE